ncbi:MAG TPA: HEPN domain-containing protein [Candidatus Nanoarchaeia archaeon]|nr:HEPN domain-containing protein [Candidatus Nanoarchaeia archaeon]
MSHAANKVDWCLKKAEKEMRDFGAHRGLVKAKPDPDKALDHISKAEHYLRATEYLRKGGFSDISASTAFYCMYHCLLAIASRHGYESRNQECTFALVRSLIEENKIGLTKEMLDKISSIDVSKQEELTTVHLRELYQYGTQLSMEDATYSRILTLAKEVLDSTRPIARQ